MEMIYNFFIHFYSGGSSLFFKIYLLFLLFEDFCLLKDDTISWFVYLSSVTF